MNRDLIKGPVMGSMPSLSVPMIPSALLQQCCNIAGTLIAGRCLGKNALALNRLRLKSYGGIN